MSSNHEYISEDYKFTADLLRRYAYGTGQDTALFRAVCSNNLAIILTALDEAAEIAECVEALVSSDEAAVPPKDKP